MRILLIDAGGKMPNLALMKLSSYLKRSGHIVDAAYAPQPLHRGMIAYEPYDMVYMSVVFKSDLPYAESVIRELDRLGIPYEVGGVGWDWRVTEFDKTPDEQIVLPDEIEHIMPDYTLYKQCPIHRNRYFTVGWGPKKCNCGSDLVPLDFGMGYVSRGCINKCSFCVMHKKEGYIHNTAEIPEFLPPGWKKLIIMDNNFFANPEWRRHAEYIIRNNIRVNFNQGLDMRILNDEIAETIVRMKIGNHTFASNQIHFAFDHPGYEPMIRKGIETLIAHGFNPRRLMFYVLVGYWTTLEQDLHRIHVILEYDADPYIMRYHKNDILLNALTEWINGRYYSTNRSFAAFLDRNPRFRKQLKITDARQLNLPEIAYRELPIGKSLRGARNEGY